MVWVTSIAPYIFNQVKSNYEIAKRRFVARKSDVRKLVFD